MSTVRVDNHKYCRNSRYIVPGRVGQRMEGYTYVHRYSGIHLAISQHPSSFNVYTSTHCIITDIEHLLLLPFLHSPCLRDINRSNTSLALVCLRHILSGPSAFERPNPVPEGHRSAVAGGGRRHGRTDIKASHKFNMGQKGDPHIDPGLGGQRTLMSAVKSELIPRRMTGQCRKDYTTI